MKFQATSIFAAVLVVLSLSAVNAIPVEGQAEAVAASAEPLLTRGETAFEVPAETKIQETNNGGKKLTGCGFRSFFTYHSCL